MASFEALGAAQGGIHRTGLHQLASKAHGPARARAARLRWQRSPTLGRGHRQRRVRWPLCVRFAPRTWASPAFCTPPLLATGGCASATESPWLPVALRRATPIGGLSACTCRHCPSTAPCAPGNTSAAAVWLQPARQLGRRRGQGCKLFCALRTGRRWLQSAPPAGPTVDVYKPHRSLSIRAIQAYRYAPSRPIDKLHLGLFILACR